VQLRRASAPGNRSAATLLRLPKLLVLTHAPWEGPHRILDAFGPRTEVLTVEALAGEPIPPHDEVSGVVAMGGPMGAEDLERHPALAKERDWLGEAVRRQIPALGICLGAQLLAGALGARVRPGESPEIGFAHIDVTEPNDPILGPLAPETTVFHWHADVFELPDGAVSLASSPKTAHQAFRYGNAWGLLFHPEADATLVEAWMEVPEMVMEAGRAIGLGAAGLLPSQAEELEDELLRRTGPGLRFFAGLVESSE
jgi:GMP synthase (glutamine-hydrolysing)